MKIKVEYTFITKFGHHVDDCKIFNAEDLEEKMGLLFPEYTNGAMGAVFNDSVKKAVGGDYIVFVCEDGSSLKFTKKEE